MKYVIIGSAIDGNKGAASMLEAAVQSLSKKDNQAEFTLLSMYPDSDLSLNYHKNLKIISAKPLRLGLVINPLTLLYRLLPPLRPLIRRNDAVKSIAEADVYLDQGGITFVDGREVFLIYNIASVLPAILVKTPVVKCAQAMGPFKSKINRFFAKLFLPKMSHIMARGAKTHEFTQNIGLKNVTPVADYAFSMNIEKPQARSAKKIFEKYDDKKQRLRIGVFPSEVLRKKAEKKGESYEKHMAQLIDGALERHKGAIVYVIPHSQRKNADKRHNNDVPVCNDIYDLVNQTDRVRYVTEPLNPQQLRHLISYMDVALVARFHAMVSALSVEVPVLVTGWSHKYQEVLDMFELNDCAYEGAAVDTSALLDSLDGIIEQKVEIKKKIAKNLPSVKKSSAQHVAIIQKAAKSSQA